MAFGHKKTCHKHGTTYKAKDGCPACKEQGKSGHPTKTGKGGSKLTFRTVRSCHNCGSGVGGNRCSACGTQQ